MDLKKLIEDRNDAFTKMKDIVEKAGAEKRAMTKEEVDEYDSLKKTVEEFDSSIARAREIRAMEREQEEPEEKAEPEKREAEQRAKEAAEERAFVAFLRHEKSPELRTDTNMTYADNSAVVPKHIAKKIIEQIAVLSPIFDLAERYNVKGTLAIPYEDSAQVITANYSDEFSTPDTTSAKLLSVTLSGYVATAQTKVSKQLINNSDFDILDFVVKNVAKKFAAFFDKELLIGTDGKIEGIAGGVTTGNTVTAASAAAVTVDELIELQDKIPDIAQQNAVWIMNPATRTAIRKLKDNNHQYYLQPDLSAKWGYKLLGRDVFCSSNMPVMAANAKAIYYGDMSGLALKIAEDLEISVDYSIFRREHGVGIFGFAETDAKVANTQKIALLKMGA